MKKLLVVLLSVLMTLAMFGCKQEPKEFDTLTIAFVPSKDADVILTAAEPLKEILKAKLAEKGYTVNNVEISVGTDYSAVGEGMISGSIDLGFIPASTYALYSTDGVKLVVEALRKAVAGSDGKTINPADGIAPWNVGATQDSATEMANGYASLLYVNIATEKGKDIYDKAVAGTLTWDDVNTARWATGSATSSASYVYPSLWINNTFGEGAKAEKRTVASLATVIPDGGYAVNMNKLLTGECDITCGYADVRKDAASQEAFLAAYADEVAAGTYTSVFDIIKVIACSDYIMNDTISAGKSEKMTDKFIAVLQECFVEIGATEEGLACVAPYSHKGYVVGKDSDYDSTRAANALFK